MSLPGGYIHIHFHDIQTSFFFETTWSMKAILYASKFVWYERPCRAGADKM